MFRKAVFLVLTILFAVALPLANGQGTTPNMGLSLPARGTLNWDVQLRANFSTLDQYYGYLTPTFQGAWSMSTTYHKGQQVSYLGSLYSSIADDATNLNNIPSSSPLSWLLMVSGGGVSSVGLTVPGEFSVSGSPVTGSSSFTVTKTTQTAGTFWGGPCTGIPATSGFRALCATDIPNITESQVTGLVSDLTAKAALASPGFSGTPTVPTPSTGDNSTRIASSAFVKNQGYVTASTAPVTSVAARTGDIVLADGDINLTDVATNNASITKHGLLKKLPNNAGLFLDGTGNFSTPGGGASVQGTTNVVQKGGGPGIAVDSSINDDGSTVTSSNPIQAPTFQFPGSSIITENGAGNINIAPVGGNVIVNGGVFRIGPSGRILVYGTTTTPSNTPGVVPIYGTPITIQGQTTALTATNIFANAPVGMYEIKGYLVVTTAGTSGGIAVNVVYTDETGPQTMVMNTLGNTGLLDSKVSFSGVVRSDGTNHDIQISTVFNAVVGTPTYSIYAVCTQLMIQ